MELLNVLHLLWRRRLLVALGGVLAVLAGIAGLGKLPGLPAKDDAPPTGLAVARVLVDRPLSLTASVPANGDDTIGPRAALIAESLAGAPEAAGVTRRAGLKPGELVIHTPSMGASPVFSELAQRSAEAAWAARGHEGYSLDVSANTDLSYIALTAAGPDRASAARLAQAGVDELRAMTAGPVRHGPSAVVIRPLGPPETALVTSGHGPMIGVIAAIFVFGAWCCGIAVLSGARRVVRRSLHSLAETAA